MNPFRWLGAKLGLVQSAQDELVSDAVVKLQLMGALTRAHTRHQVEQYLDELDAAGHTSLAAKVREELAVSGLLLMGQPTTPAAVAGPGTGHAPAALPPAPPASAGTVPSNAPRKRGRPRKHPSPGESFPGGPPV